MPRSNALEWQGIRARALRVTSGKTIDDIMIRTSLHLDPGAVERALLGSCGIRRLLLRLLCLHFTCGLEQGTP